MNTLETKQAIDDILAIAQQVKTDLAVESERLKRLAIVVDDCLTKIKEVVHGK